jgi:SulP family sulfate permease
VVPEHSARTDGRRRRHLRAHSRGHRLFFRGGVDPAVGLFASFIIGIVIAFTGGRPAMVSAAAGSVALVAAPLVHAHGLPYLLAAGVLAGAMQIVFGLLRLGVLMRFVSSSVRTGFVNALAILIFAAQMPHFIGANMATWAMVGLGLAVIYLLPRLTTAVPSPLVCIVVVTLVGHWLGLPLKTVADLGQLPMRLPAFALPRCRSRSTPCASSRCPPSPSRWSGCSNR